MARNRDKQVIPGGASGQPETYIQSLAGINLSDTPKPLPTAEELKGVPGKVWYTVLNGGIINIPGSGKTTIRQGKRVNDVDFDIKLLIMQGIKLEKIEPEETKTESTLKEPDSWPSQKKKR